MPYTTQQELEEIVDLLEVLNNHGAAHISIGSFKLYDSNGEPLGTVMYGDGSWVFKGQGTN